MLRHKMERSEWLEFEIFQEFPEVIHGVFLKDAEMPHQEIVSAYQIQGAKVLEARIGGEKEKCDGLVTDKQGVGLLIKHADCQATIFYDPIQKVIGAVHAGWRGQVQNIYQEAVGQLGKLYGCKPENLVVGVSPSLGPCCAQFIHYETELPANFWEHQVKPLYFDLWEIARRQLIKAGVLGGHIQVAEICTCCNPNDFFSYRRDKVKGRNQSTVIMVRARKGITSSS